jgi:16S rRNA (uracil1498-N3)-methyltransferase
MRQFFLENISDLNKSDLIKVDKALEKRIFKVLRFKNGENLNFINGKGLLIYGKIKDSKIFVIDKKTFKQKDFKINLFVSLIRKERFDTMVEKATELGADTITPFFSRYTRPFKKDDKYLKRWQKISNEALSQCKRVFKCNVLDFKNLDEIIKEKRDGIDIFFHPGEEKFNFNIKKDLNIFIGPEGGFSEEEFKKMKDFNFKAYKMTDNILRTETAVFYALSIVSFNLN